MTPKNRYTQQIVLLLLPTLLLSSCARASDRIPIGEIYDQFYSSTPYFGNYFFTFQNVFLNITLFILLFTLFQYWQNRRQDYLHYIFYLLATWVYFARAFPPYFYSLFQDKVSFSVFNRLFRYPGGWNDQTEFICFCLLTIGYALFTRSFFDLKNTEPIGFKITRYTILTLVTAAILQLIVLLTGLSQAKNFEF